MRTGTEYTKQHPGKDLSFVNVYLQEYSVPTTNCRRNAVQHFLHFFEDYDTQKVDQATYRA